LCRFIKSCLAIKILAPVVFIKSWHNVKNVVAAKYQSFNLTNEPLELGMALKMEIQYEDIDKILQEIFSV